MMDQLSAAEDELAKKKAEADQDMMMAGMVRPASDTAVCFYKDTVSSGCLLLLQASDNAKEAEDNARKAKNTVKTVLNAITTLLDQLGKNRTIIRIKFNKFQLSFFF